MNWVLFCCDACTFDVFYLHFVGNIALEEELGILEEKSRKRMSFEHSAGAGQLPHFPARRPRTCRKLENTLE